MLCLYSYYIQDTSLRRYFLVKKNYIIPITAYFCSDKHCRRSGRLVYKYLMLNIIDIKAYYCIIKS